MKFELPDAAATGALGRAIAAALPDRPGGWLVLLEGELGSGKTTLARALLCALGHGGAVPSPTYTLVEPYDVPCGMVYHIDLYRIADASELPYLGWDEFGDGLRLVEWPERAPALYAEADIRVRLDYCDAVDAGRQASVQSMSERASATFATRLERAFARARGHGGQAG